VTSQEVSPSARAVAAARHGDVASAEAIVTDLIREVFHVEVASLVISKDRYSLNSLNGLVQLRTGEELFFKFHHEEAVEVTLEEFYRGELLEAAGYPIDMPVLVSREVGKQLLLYRRRTGPRFSDICDRLEDQSGAELDVALSAQRHLDAMTYALYAKTFHKARPEEVAAEPINQLFFHRLASPSDRGTLGARARRFFFGREFRFPGATLEAETLRSAKWVINGIEYEHSIGDLLDRSLRLLEPHSLAAFGAVVAHGDAHNANVWFEENNGGPARLVFFDPAFAGKHISALIADAKATFHNIFAHPRWLYNPSAVAEKYRIEATFKDGGIEIHTDWKLTALREAFLEIKASALWSPLLLHLRERGLLNDNWRETLRAALFCCPTLVMDLSAGGAGGHTPESSALGLAVAVSVGSEPGQGGADRMSKFLDAITPGCN
jgi:hypothetical protein